MSRIMLIAGVAAALAGPAAAHHSGAMFDRSRTVTLEGTVKAYQYTNPHCWIILMVPGADGKVEEWGVEGSPPPMMKKLGVTPSVVTPGAKVTVRAHPLKDGRPGGSFVDITFADGRTIVQKGG